MILPKLPASLAYGGDYNPEQWPESVWREDARLMREAGVNLVSVGIFSWAKLQPAEKRYDFGWLDRVMDLLADHGVYVCLATATASPPPWMSRKHPDVLPVDANGVTLFPGSRQHYSPCSPSYRRLAAALVRKIALRYRRHPALAAWHINNEYACHLPECHSEATTRAFRVWLKRRYRTLEALNAAWGTAFWSQVYYAWDEIFTPRRAPYHCNPTQQLDYRRFYSDAMLELHRMEKDILNELAPGVPVTTNFMGFFKTLDYRRWAGEVDFVAWDSYPDPLPGLEPERVGAVGHDLMRSLKKDRPFVLMEQASSAVNWRNTNGPKAPGRMRLGSLQTVARGGDGVMFFQWRASKAGAEKFHSGMVQHIEPARSRVFAEIKRLGADLEALAPVTGSLVRARVAIAFDWHAWWAVELESKPGRIDYAGWAQELHRFFYTRNIAVDFVAPGEPLDDYALVVAPALYLLAKADADNLSTFVAKGGTLLATYFSGIVDEHEHIVLGGYPAWLREVLGLWVEEWVPYAEGQENLVRFAGARGPVFKASHWCDVVHLEGAKALATFAGDYFAGRAAVTENAHGRGRAFYLGTRLERAGLDRVLSTVCASAGVEPVLATPAGVEATRREHNGQSFLFLLNHRDEAVRVKLGRNRGTDLLTKKPVRGSVNLPPREVAVVALA
jgi:beta-galactosidase